MAPTRKNGRGLASRVFRPVGKAVNVAGKIVKTGFTAAKNIGHHVVKGANNIISNVGKSFSKGKRTRRGKRSTRKH
jgi:hypothetical protein